MTTLVVYSDADPESTSVDGRVRHAGTNITWAAVQGGAGTNSNDVTPGGVTNSCGELEAGSTTDRWAQMERGVFLFDTSTIGSGETITSITLSLYGISKDTTLGATDLDVVSSAPASNTALAAGDYDSLGTSVYGSISSAGFTTSAYNDITLSAGVTKAGITKLGTRLAWDTDNAAPTWSSGVKTSLRAYYADQTGTTNDPKLTVIYSSGVTVTPAVLDQVIDLPAATLTLAKAPAVVDQVIDLPTATFVLAKALDALDQVIELLAPSVSIAGGVTVEPGVLDQVIELLAPSVWLEAAFYLDEATTYAWYVDAVDNYGLAVT